MSLLSLSITDLASVVPVLGKGPDRTISPRAEQAYLTTWILDSNKKSTVQREIISMA